jgi:hypothetical protein
MLDWPAVEPADFRCPTLWLIGSQDPYAMATYKEYEASLAGSQVQVQLLQGLNHEQVFDQIDQVLPILLAFTQKQSDLRGSARAAALGSPAAQLMRGPLDGLHTDKE